MPRTRTTTANLKLAEIYFHL